MTFSPFLCPVCLYSAFPSRELILPLFNPTPPFAWATCIHAFYKKKKKEICQLFIIKLHSPQLCLCQHEFVRAKGGLSVADLPSETGSDNE